MKIINFHVLDKQNIGDRLSSPLRYFEFPGFSFEAQDIRVAKVEALEKSHVIIGGGGLLFEHFLPKIKSIRDAVTSGKYIFWGVGQQSYGTPNQIRGVNFDYIPYLSHADLIGIRDYGFSFPWVPCVSCMHPAFDKKRAAKHEFVVFSHKKFQIHVPDLPRMTNANQNFEDVLDFLGSGEVILTSSFHGAYWGTLLGRRVIAFPFSSKFSTLKHLPVLYPVPGWSRIRWQFSLFGRTLYKRQNPGDTLTCQISDWRNYTRKARTFPDSLEECRERNWWFYQQVMGILNE